MVYRTLSFVLPIDRMLLADPKVSHNSTTLLAYGAVDYIVWMVKD